eukprot:TRINITY_DN632_c0_g3_i3.p1 TRINITY_DN632_c0_g3~~TRINITY_DN632_c0_g3_i3.p1  ORF type:complete len:285 (-),score=86.26 TRINITY_DN632_c0_g3_i3:90-944(-)
MEIYQTYPMIKEIAKESLIPVIFDSLYQLDTRNDNSKASQLVFKLADKKTYPIEDRCFSILLDKMGLHKKALEHLNRYFESKESRRDVLALNDKIKLELACYKPDEALSSSNLLLALIPYNTKACMSKIDALVNLNKKSQAIIELTKLMGEITDPTYKAKLYKQRADLRTSKELNEKVGDLEMSCKLCPQLETRKEILKLLYRGQQFGTLNEMFNKTVTKKEIDEDFDIAIMRGDLYRAFDNDFEKALEVYKKVKMAAPDSFKARVDARIEITEEKLKRDEQKN